MTHLPVSIRMPHDMIEVLDELVEQGEYETRSHAVRDAVEECFYVDDEDEASDGGYGAGGYGSPTDGGESP